MENYLMEPVNVRMKSIEPIYFPLVTEIFQRGLDEETEYPAVFDYRETDKETRESSLLVSFLVTQNNHGLIIEKIKGKKRKRIMAEIENLKPVKRKSTVKKSAVKKKKKKAVKKS